MIYLKPITHDSIHDFAGTSYDAMSFEEKQNMIEESIHQVHNGFYFECLAVCKQGVTIGFMNLYAHSKHIISCGPEIKADYQNKGYGFVAETLALKYAKEKGYTVAVGGVHDSNAASIALHEKLGFELDRKYSNRTGKTIRLYIKVL